MSVFTGSQNKFLGKFGLLAILILAFLGGGSTAKADQIFIVGNATGALSTATVDCSFNAQNNTLTFTITNTSPFDARITGIGFDLTALDFPANPPSSAGLTGFAEVSGVTGFTFRDTALGNVPQFNDAVLDFGWTTGNAGSFNAGSPNDGLANAANGGSAVTFSVSGGAFAGLTTSQICNAIFVRFQRVGEDGEGSDVGTPGTPGAPVPEPATMLLLGTGLVGLGAGIRRWRRK